MKIHSYSSPVDMFKLNFTAQRSQYLPIHVTKCDTSRGFMEDRQCWKGRRVQTKHVMVSMMANGRRGFEDRHSEGKDLFAYHRRNLSVRFG